MSDEAAATWTNGDGGGKESEAVLDSYCQPPDPDNSTEPSRKRMRSSSSDSNQSSAESSLTSQNQKKMKIVVRIRQIPFSVFCRLLIAMRILRNIIGKVIILSLNFNMKP